MATTIAQLSPVELSKKILRRPVVEPDCIGISFRRTPGQLDSAVATSAVCSTSAIGSSAFETDSAPARPSCMTAVAKNVNESAVILIVDICCFSHPLSRFYFCVQAMRRLDGAVLDTRPHKQETLGWFRDWVRPPPPPRHRGTLTCGRVHDNRLAAGRSPSRSARSQRRCGSNPVRISLPCTSATFAHRARPTAGEFWFDDAS